MIERFQFPLQRGFIHVAEDRVVDFDDWSERALTEAGHGSQCRAAVGSGERQLLRLAVRRGLEPELHKQVLEQIARTPGVACGAAADRYRVAALRLEVEQREERRDAVNPREGNRCSGCDVVQRLERQILSRVIVLDLLQDRQERARTPGLPRQNSVDEVLADR